MTSNVDGHVLDRRNQTTIKLKSHQTLTAMTDERLDGSRAQRLIQVDLSILLLMICSFSTRIQTEKKTTQDKTVTDVK